jgi:ribonuclease HI
MTGHDPSTTNNRMELRAVIEALLFVQDDEYNIYTDSQLTMNCAMGVWKRKANLDLWERYESALRGRKLNWHWVRGHSGDQYNTLVDKLANNAARNPK